MGGRGGWWWCGQRCRAALASLRHFAGVFPRGGEWRINKRDWAWSSVRFVPVPVRDCMLLVEEGKVHMLSSCTLESGVKRKHTLKVGASAKLCEYGRCLFFPVTSPNRARFQSLILERSAKCSLICSAQQPIICMKLAKSVLEATLMIGSKDPHSLAHQPSISASHQVWEGLVWRTSTTLYSFPSISLSLPGLGWLVLAQSTSQMSRSTVHSTPPCCGPQNIARKGSLASRHTIALTVRGPR